MTNTPAGHGCRCSYCAPGIAGNAPNPGHHHFDREDLELLMRLGLPDVARQLAAGTCPDCGLSRASRTHREHCEEARRPLRALPQPAQPWQPRPSRHALRAA